VNVLPYPNPPESNPTPYGKDSADPDRMFRGIREKLTRLQKEAGNVDTTAASYAESVVGVLREHFPDLADPTAAEIIARAVRRQANDPHDAFEVIVDNPRSANWRLRAWREDRRRVHLACYRMTERDQDVQFTRTVNDALAALKV
jgi:hypothetical protein